MKTYQFRIMLQGTGETEEIAWLDACEGFGLDSGPIPDDNNITLLEDDESEV